MKLVPSCLLAALLSVSTTAQNAAVTVLHGVPNLPAPVEVFANGSSLFSFDYGDQQGPLSLPPGSYALEVRLNGAPILNLNATLQADTDYSVIPNLDASGAPQLQAFVNPLDNLTLPTSRLYVRHTAEAPAVDVLLLQDGATFATIPNVVNGAEAVADVPPGTYSVQLNAAGTNNVAFGPVDVAVEDGVGYAVFATGEVGTQNFTLLTQRIPLTALVTVVHGIPGLGAPVTVRAGGNPLFSFDYREVVGPLAVLPGTYDFDVVLNGAPVLARTDTVARGDDVTIVAHLDDAAPPAPVLSAFANDTSAVPTLNSRVIVRHLAAAPTVDVVVENVGQPLATIAGLANGDEASALLPTGNLSVRLEAGGVTVFGPINFRPVDHLQYQFLALGDFNGGTFSVELVQRDLSPAVPGEITTSVGGWSCGPAISAVPANFDYGQQWTLRTTGSMPNMPALINFGDSISSFSGAPLPVALDGFGAPGCFLNTNVLATLGAMTDASGDLEVPFTIPTTLFGQLAPGFFQVGTMTTGNALGIVSSEYLEIR